MFAIAIRWALAKLPWLGSWQAMAVAAAIALAGAAYGGWWLAVTLYKADELAKLEKRIDFFIEQTAAMDALAVEYEQRKAKRMETVVKYVEKDAYRNCVPDAQWVRDINAAIKSGSAR